MAGLVEVQRSRGGWASCRSNPRGRTPCTSAGAPSDRRAEAVLAAFAARLHVGDLVEVPHIVAMGPLPGLARRRSASRPRHARRTRRPTPVRAPEPTRVRSTKRVTRPVPKTTVCGRVNTAGTAGPVLFRWGSLPPACHPGTPQKAPIEAARRVRRLETEAARPSLLTHFEHIGNKGDRQRTAAPDTNQRGPRAPLTCCSSWVVTVGDGRFERPTPSVSRKCSNP